MITDDISALEKKRDELQAARNEATAAYNFQLAGAVHAELEAVEKQIAALAPTSSDGITQPGAGTLIMKGDL